MPYVVTARWRVKSGHEPEVLDAIRHLVPASRAEAGCRFYQAARDPDDPRVFFFYEIYEDEAAAKAHGASEHVRRYVFEIVRPLLEERERVVYETLLD